MKLIKWITVTLIIIIMLIIFIDLFKLRWSYPDMTSRRFFMNFWRKYLIADILLISGYLSINKLLK